MGVWEIFLTFAAGFVSVLRDLAEKKFLPMLIINYK